jgi:hypothetical protein
MTSSNITELELKARELELRRQDLELHRAKLFIDFAKFGFAGTLTAAIAGMALLMVLAVLAAFTAFRIDTSALIAIAFTILVGCTAFGFLSLWELPRIVARFQKMQFSVNPTSNTSS